MKYVHETRVAQTGTVRFLSDDARKSLKYIFYLILENVFALKTNKKSTIQIK